MPFLREMKKFFKPSRKIQGGENYVCVKYTQRGIVMGLTSDYLEQNRDRGMDNFVSITLSRQTFFLNVDVSYFWRKHVGAKKWNPVLHAMPCHHRQSDDTAMLSPSLKELSRLRAEATISEKLLLEAENLGGLKSPLVRGLIATVREEAEASGSLIDVEMARLGGGANEPCDEAEVRRRLLHLVAGGTLYALQHGFLADTSFFRYIVKDLASLLRLWNGANGSEPDKKLVRCYLERKFSPTLSVARCQNCGRRLFEGLPYCFNCYERNEL